MVEDQIIVAAQGAILGVIYGLYGYVTKSDTDERLKPKKLIRTTLLWGAAGIVVSTSYGVAQVDPESVEAELATVSMVGVIFDHAWGKLKREGLLPSFLYDNA